MKKAISVLLTHLLNILRMMAKTHTTLQNPWCIRANFSSKPKYGARRYETSDTSRNNFLFALLAMGEGWHNNHHHYPASARQGFMWWEIDVTYYVIKLMELLGIVWDVAPVPASVLDRNKVERKSKSDECLDLEQDEIV